jgi:hypothetical protein
MNRNGERMWCDEGIMIDTSSRLQGVLGVYNGPIPDTYLIHWTRTDLNYLYKDHRLQLVDSTGNL